MFETLFGDNKLLLKLKLDFSGFKIIDSDFRKSIKI